jgi:hypothetical protein
VTIEPSSRTATVAGAWSVLGFIPFDAWLASHPNAPASVTTALWAIVAVVFLFVPMFFLVIGRGSAPFGRLWFLDAIERARYGVVARRLLIWFLSAAVSGTVWSMLFYSMWPKR